MMYKGCIKANGIDAYWDMTSATKIPFHSAIYFMCSKLIHYCATTTGDAYHTAAASGAKQTTSQSDKGAVMWHALEQQASSVYKQRQYKGHDCQHFPLELTSVLTECCRQGMWTNSLWRDKTESRQPWESHHGERVEYSYSQSRCMKNLA